MQQTDAHRRLSLSGIGMLSLLLSAVIVLSTTPAVLAGSLVDPLHPISRVGSQIRRIATAVPLRASKRQHRHDEERPWWPEQVAAVRLRLAGVTGVPLAFSRSFCNGLPLHCLDLPPPRLA